MTDRRTKPRSGAASLPRKVSFGHLTIHEHAYIPGDNPGGSSGGPPISIDWTCQQTVKFEISHFEERRPTRRCGAEMRIPPAVRDRKLRDAGFSRAEINKSLKAANITKAQRERTNEMSHMDSVEEIAERMKRSTLGIFKRKGKKEKKAKTVETPVSKEPVKRRGLMTHESSTRILSKRKGKANARSAVTVRTEAASSSFKSAEDESEEMEC